MTCTAANLRLPDASRAARVGSLQIALRVGMMALAACFAFPGVLASVGPGGSSEAESPGSEGEYAPSAAAHAELREKPRGTCRGRCLCFVMPVRLLRQSVQAHSAPDRRLDALAGISVDAPLSLRC